MVRLTGLKFKLIILLFLVQVAGGLLLALALGLLGAFALVVGLAGLELGYLVFVTSGNLLLALGFLAALALVVGLARFEIGDLLFITGTLLLALLGTLALVMPLLESGQGPGGCSKRDQRSLVLVSGMIS